MSEGDAGVEGVLPQAKAPANVAARQAVESARGMGEGYCKATRLRRGDKATRPRGYKATRPEARGTRPRGDEATRLRRGDKATRLRGDEAVRRQGYAARRLGGTSFMLRCEQAGAMLE